MRLAIALLSTAVASCANIVAVNHTAARLVAASDSWNDVLAEYRKSCEREMRTTSAINDCTRQSIASDQLTKTNAVLASYFIALRDASDEKNLTIQPGLDDLVTSFKEIPGVPADQVEAVSGLFGLLTHLATQAMREEIIKDLIVGGTDDARTLISALEKLTGPLDTQLTTEEDKLTGLFGTKINSVHDDGTNPMALCQGNVATTLSGTGYLLSLEYCRQAQVISQRKDALAKYRSSLREADSALSELKSSKDTLSNKALAQHLYAIGASLQSNVEAVRKAYN